MAIGEGLKGGLWPYTGMGEGLEGDDVHIRAWGRGLKEMMSVNGRGGLKVFRVHIWAYGWG